MPQTHQVFFPRIFINRWYYATQHHFGDAVLARAGAVEVVTVAGCGRVYLLKKSYMIEVALRKVGTFVSPLAIVAGHEWSMARIQ